MRRFAFAILITGALILAGNVSARTGRVTDSKVRQGAVTFDTPVKLMGVVLKGQYLFVHDEEKMARGEDCTSVYTYLDGKQGNLVVSFHCIPIEREKTDHFTVSVRMLPGVNLYELIEYRFAGSTEGHKIPVDK